MSAEFNTMTKHYSKLAAQNYERSNPSNEQWGGQNHRSSTDAAMIKMLGYESVRMNKDTMMIMNYDADADFDRMYHEYENMLNVKKTCQPGVVQVHVWYHRKSGEECGNRTWTVRDIIQKH